MDDLLYFPVSMTVHFVVSSRDCTSESATLHQASIFCVNPDLPLLFIVYLLFIIHYIRVITHKC